MPFLKIKKFLFYVETGEQSLLMLLVIYANQDQNQMTEKKLVRSFHMQSSLTKLEIFKSHLNYQSN